LQTDEEKRPEVVGESKRGRPARKCQMVDITALLSLPQRDAALHLGISESMLCKRYKECTNLKWPHRYLGKLDKKIAAKRAALAHAPSALDDEALVKLLEEKARILKPVQIRLSDVQEDGEDEEQVTEKRTKFKEEKEHRGTEQSMARLFEDELDLLQPGQDLHTANILLTLCGGS
jgi:hypothetical protein